MKRRDFFKYFSTAAVLSALPSLSKAKKPEFNWKMVTTWPKNFPGLGTGAKFLADYIIKIVAGSIEEYDEFQQVLIKNIEFNSMSSGISLQELKSTTILPIK